MENRNEALPSVFFSERSEETFPIYNDYYLKAFNGDDDDGLFDILNIDHAFDSYLSPRKERTILRTLFQRDVAFSEPAKDHHPLRPIIFSGLSDSDRIIICGTIGSSLNIISTDISRRTVTHQSNVSLQLGDITTDLAFLQQSTNDQGTMLVSEKSSLRIYRVNWGLTEKNSSILNITPKSKCPLVCAGRIREIDVTRESHRAVMAGHSNHIQVVDLNVWQCVRKVKSHGVVGSIRWEDDSSNILTWTTDEGFVMFFFFFLSFSLFSSSLSL